MNFSQLHEQLRTELLRRIERGLLTGALLARQTGLAQSTISNFLKGKRGLSLPALDRVLAAQNLSAEDLVAVAAPSQATTSDPQRIPLVSQATAMNDAVITETNTSELIQLPAVTLSGIRARQSVRRRQWDRFVAIGVTPAQAEPMAPLLQPNMVVVLDRHNNSIAPFSPDSMDIYAVKVGRALFLRYVTFEANRLILRPHVLQHPIRLVEIEPTASPSDLIIGRVCASITQR